MDTVFIVNGPLSALIAINIFNQQKHIGNDICFLVERVESQKLIERQTKTTNTYAEIARSLIRANLGDVRVEMVDIKRYFVNPILSPKRAIKEHFGIQQAILGISDDIKKTPKTIIFSGNSILQNYLAKDGVQLIKFEHGIGDYVDARKKTIKRRIKLWARKRANIILGIPWERVPSIRYLMDGGKSETLKKMGVKSIVSLNTPEIKKCAEQFLLEKINLSKKLEKILNEINDLSKLYRVIIYLPCESIPYNLYNEFFENQIKDMDLSKVYFIIKSHPTDSGNYSELFNQKNLLFKEINEDEIKNIPVEMILAMLPKLEVMGRGSSALFYAKWWFNRNLHTRSGKISSKIIDEIEKSMYPDMKNIC